MLLFGHDALVVPALRYLVEGLTEAELMDADPAPRDRQLLGHRLAARRPAGCTPDVFNDVAHLHAQGARPTTEDEVHAEPV